MCALVEYNMEVEKYIAVAGLGLFIMFVGENITIYNFMIESSMYIASTAKILQFISIGAAPASVLTGISFIMAKRSSSKFISVTIILSGSVLLVGMLITYNMINYIAKTYLVIPIILNPIIFIIVSISVILTGLVLNKKKHKR